MFISTPQTEFELYRIHIVYGSIQHIRKRRIYLEVFYARKVLKILRFTEYSLLQNTTGQLFLKHIKLIRKDVVKDHFIIIVPLVIPSNFLIKLSLFVTIQPVLLCNMRSIVPTKPGPRLAGTGWKTSWLHINVTTNLWRNDCSCLISSIAPSS